MKIALCLLIKDENDYLDEWINHHILIGIDHFFIYDNNSKIPIKYDSDLVTIKNWNYNEIGTQNNCYKYCCNENKEYDYIGFLDTDEFYYSKTMDIKKDFEDLSNKFGSFDGLGLYWRMYGNFNPYFLNRVKINDYKYYHLNNHIKSFINPKKVNYFLNPHHAIINGNYIDENGYNILSAIGTHTSKNIWIKHTWTRSLNEFKEKIIRGSGDKVVRNYTLENFYDYNNKCLILDENE